MTSAGRLDRAGSSARSPLTDSIQPRHPIPARSAGLRRGCGGPAARSASPDRRLPGRWCCAPGWSPRGETARASARPPAVRCRAIPCAGRPCRTRPSVRRQIDERDALFAGHLQRRRRAIGHGLGPAGRHVAARADLRRDPRARPARAGKVEAHHLVVDFLGSACVTCDSPSTEVGSPPDHVAAPVDQLDQVVRSRNRSPCGSAAGRCAIRWARADGRTAAAGCPAAWRSAPSAAAWPAPAGAETRP